ncbi:MAG TPA: hypothetical protein VGO67_05620 [Verrucomicrobiae bacterium]|jgi:hypothetical protein
MQSKAKVYWIKTERGLWGPFDWKHLREWLALGWLPRDLQISDDEGENWACASSIEMLWTKTKAIADSIEAFGTLDLMSTKLPISKAQTERIRSLGWPGDTKLLKNYYWCDRLRKELEKLLPNAANVPFDDPEWPWDGGSPAEAERRMAQIERERLAMPPTENQEAVLQFLLGSRHGIRTFGEASIKIGELLANTENRARWEAHNSSVPATVRQIERLTWASRRVRRPLPIPLTKATAHNLIDAWFDEFPDLESEWMEEKHKRGEERELGEEFEAERETVASDVDDWREFYGCRKVSEHDVESVLKFIESRKQGEGIDDFMKRFFAALHQQKPGLFTRQVGSRSQLATPRGKGCMVVLSGILAVVIYVVLCALG